MQSLKQVVQKQEELYRLFGNLMQDMGFEVGFPRPLKGFYLRVSGGGQSWFKFFGTSSKEMWKAADLLSPFYPSISVEAHEGHCVAARPKMETRLVLQKVDSEETMTVNCIISERANSIRIVSKETLLSKEEGSEYNHLGYLNDVFPLSSFRLNEAIWKKDPDLLLGCKFWWPVPLNYWIVVHATISEF